jgi:hypothetical protein
MAAIPAPVASLVTPQYHKHLITARTDHCTLTQLHVSTILFRQHYHSGRKLLFLNVGNQVPTTYFKIRKSESLKISGVYKL